MKDLERIAGLVGLARKAGNLVIGSDAVEVALRKGKIFALICAEDASQLTIGTLKQSSAADKVPLFQLFSKDQLGRLTGRKTLAVLGVNDQSFANAIQGLVEQM